MKESKKVFMQSVKELIEIRANLQRLAMAHVHQHHRKHAAKYEASIQTRRLGSDEGLNTFIEAIVDTDETIKQLAQWI